MNINRLLTAVLTFFVLIIFGATKNTAAPGDLDLTFSGDGKLVVAEPFYHSAQAFAIQADGKIVAVGNELLRFTPDGSLDTTFGGGDGKVEIVSRNGYAAAIQPDGKIVAAGCQYFYHEKENFYHCHLGLVRYQVDGSLDASFGNNGVAETEMWFDPTGESYVAYIAIQPDGKIVAASYHPNNSSVRALLRYNSNGELDTTFGVDGVRQTIDSSFDRDIALQPDGKIVLSGYSNGELAVARHNADGSWDLTFDSDGVATMPLTPDNIDASSVAIQPDGKIVAAGSARYNGWSGHFGLIRYNPNGSLDTTFGTDGIVITPLGLSNSWARSVAIQPDGKIVAAGYSRSSNDFDFTIVRYNSDGSLDTTLGGGDGITSVDFNNSYDFVNRLALDGQGRAVVMGQAGFVHGQSNGAVALARIILGRTTRSHFDFDNDGRADVSVFRPTDRVWYLDRSTDGFSTTQFGLSTDKIAPADYDGDGKTDIAVYRDGTWYWLNSSDGSFAAYQFGIAGDVPVPADYTGDQRSELAVYRNGVWWTHDLATNESGPTQFGASTDKPVVADYDGDGRVDQAVYRDGLWHMNRSSDGYTAVQFGLSSDRPVVGDFDGDGRSDIAVYRDGTWYMQQSTDGFTAVQFGISTDTPTPADYDGDGRTDMAVFRNGTWYLQQTTSGFSVVNFGLSGDKPVPAAFLP